jgi:predicted SprT family Zn-dependent metalloprotease
MQLDFFGKLAARVKQALETPKTENSPTASASPTQPTLQCRRTDEPARESNPLQETARNLLRTLACHDLAERVQVRWNPRMRSTAGTAYPGKALITLNPRLIAFGDEEVDKTLRHELAHLLAHHRMGRRRIAPHGAEWQQACRDLGLVDEKRCHDLPLPRRKIVRRFVYRCPNCAVEMRRARPLRRKSACLACCRRFHGGRYDEKFRFVKIVNPPPNSGCE